MHFLASVFPCSPHPKPLSLRERGLKAYVFALLPFSLLNFVHAEKGRGMRAKSA
jgi:hypothetical protein